MSAGDIPPDDALERGRAALLLESAARFPDRAAIAARGRVHSYADLLQASGRVAHALLAGRPDLEEARVAFLVPPGFAHVAVQWGIWRAGAVAVPLAVSHPPPELEWVLDDSTPTALVVDPAFAPRITGSAGVRGLRWLDSDALLVTGDAPDRPTPAGLPRLTPARRALMLYTSGTTGRPKGVVTTHSNLSAQVEALVQAWGWQPDDRILHVLPLHHVHGIINVLSCALRTGACCEFLDAFEPEPVWARVAAGDITLFMAVPTIYHRLITAWEAAAPDVRDAWSRGARRLRLMVSGSAALPVPTLERWRAITGHTLLERYGMTEIGMALSNPFAGERRPGSVGRPLPGVELRLVDDDGRAVPPGTPGRIETRGPQVFLEYWNRPEETRNAFRDGWFITGDEAVLEDGRYRILGRSSVDIIKSAGYKLSALEIEDALRAHPDVQDCAVVGIPDEDLGERVCAAVVLRPGSHCHGESLRAWARERIAPYKLPRSVLIVTDLPRNAMGKVTKPAVRALFPQ
jgi:malonyl-CoA/methylmalonyl-CoA synthetase